MLTHAAAAVSGGAPLHSPSPFPAPAIGPWSNAVVGEAQGPVGPVSNCAGRRVSVLGDLVKATIHSCACWVASAVSERVVKTHLVDGSVAAGMSATPIQIRPMEGHRASVRCVLGGRGGL